MKYIMDAIKTQYKSEIKAYTGLRVLVDCLEEELINTDFDEANWELYDILNDINDSIKSIRTGVMQ